MVPRAAGGSLAVDEPLLGVFVVTDQGMLDNAFRHVKKHGRYRSRFEAEVARQLEALEADFLHEAVCIPYGDGQFYIPDFTITRPSGYVFHVEAKGWMPDRDVKKYARLAVRHPDLDLRFVFQNAKARTGFSKRPVSSFVRRQGWLWAEGQVPAAWFE